MMFLIFPTRCFFKPKFPVEFYHCRLLQTTYRNVQDAISRHTFSTECRTLNKGNTEAMSCSNSIKQDMAISTIRGWNRSFSGDNVIHQRTFKPAIKICYQNITTCAALNAHNTIESNNNDSNDTQSNSRASKNNISTSDTTNTNKTLESSNIKSNANKPLYSNNGKSESGDSSIATSTTTTAAGTIRCPDQEEMLKAEFQQLEKNVAAGLDRTRLSANDWLVHEAHANALTSSHLTYECPVEARTVKTRLNHFLRGNCCGNACRHCVYNHENVTESVRQRRIFNSSFYVVREPDPKDQPTTSCGWGPLRQLQQAEEDIELNF